MLTALGATLSLAGGSLAADNLAAGQQVAQSWVALAITFLGLCVSAYPLFVKERDRRERRRK